MTCNQPAPPKVTGVRLFTVEGAQVCFQELDSLPNDHRTKAFDRTAIFSVGSSVNFQVSLGKDVSLQSSPSTRGCLRFARFIVTAAVGAWRRGDIMGYLKGCHEAGLGLCHRIGC